MREFTEQFFDLILNLDPDWKVEKVVGDYRLKEVEIKITFIGKKVECPNTFEMCGIYDHSPERRWRHLDLFDYKTYIVCNLPRIKNEQEKVVTIIPPWASKSTRYTHQFEVKVIDILKATQNQTKTAELMNCSFNQVNRILHNSVKRGLERRPKDVAFKHLSLDEKSFKRNHKYVTVLSSPTSGVIIDICEDRTKKATKELLNTVISKDNRDKVETISVDMWKAYLESIKDVLPETKVVHDRFHLVQYLNKAIDKVRRREVKDHQELKNSKYALLKNQENLTEKQRIKFECIKSANFQVSKAWVIRENFKDIFGSNTMAEAVELFWKWGANVLSTNIKEMVKVARMFNNHLSGVCNAMVETFSNAMAERLNGKIQELKARSRGYRTFKNFRSAILFFHGELNLYPLYSQ